MRVPDDRPALRDPMTWVVALGCVAALQGGLGLATGLRLELIAPGVIVAALVLVLGAPLIDALHRAGGAIDDALEATLSHDRRDQRCRRLADEAERALARGSAREARDALERLASAGPHPLSRWAAQALDEARSSVGPRPPRDAEEGLGVLRDRRERWDRAWRALGEDRARAAPPAPPRADYRRADGSSGEPQRGAGSPGPGSSGEGL